MEDTKTNETRGGRREGCGRKPYTGDGMRVTLTFRVSPVTKERIAKLKEHGVKIGLSIDDHIARLCKDLGIED